MPLFFPPSVFFGFFVFKWKTNIFLFSGCKTRTVIRSVLQTHLGERAFAPLGNSFNRATHMKKLFMWVCSELLLIHDFKIWGLKKLAPSGLRLVIKWWKLVIQRQSKGNLDWLTDSRICSCYGRHISSGFLQFLIKLSISKRHICKSILKMWISKIMHLCFYTCTGSYLLVTRELHTHSLYDCTDTV